MTLPPFATEETCRRAYLFPVPCEFSGHRRLALVHCRRPCNGTEATPHRFAGETTIKETNAASQGRPRRDRHSTAEPCLAFRPDGARVGQRALRGANTLRRGLPRRRAARHRLAGLGNGARARCRDRPPAGVFQGTLEG